MAEKDEFDIDISEISGDMPVREGVLAQMANEPHVVDPESSEYADVVARLTEHCNRMWIAYPTKEGDKFMFRDLENCPSEDFYSWMCYIYPVTKTSNVTADDYKELDARQKSFVAVIQFLQRMKIDTSKM
jgi:hypothetical protein